MKIKKKLIKRNIFLPIAAPLIGKEEEQAVLETLRSGWLTIGPKTVKFEEELAKYVDAKFAIALNSCSSALHLAIYALGLGKGDEVITTPFTFVATAFAITHCGAKPVFVDIDRKTLSIDLTKIENAITKKTKAIIPVHYGGVAIDLDKLHKIAKKHKLTVIEDAAHAIGTIYKNKKIGALSDLTCFSFHPVKNLTTGDGGAITTNNEELARKLKILRVNGMEKDAWKRLSAQGNWDYLVTEEGFKFHMNDLSATIGLAQLKKLDKFNAKRKKLHVAYINQLKDQNWIMHLPIDPKDGESAYNLFPIQLTSKYAPHRNEIMEKLKELNIGTVVYYRPLHMQPYFINKYRYKNSDFPQAYAAFESLICLPLWPGMKLSDVTFVCDALKQTIQAYQ